MHKDWKLEIGKKLPDSILNFSIVSSIILGSLFCNGTNTFVSTVTTVTYVLIVPTETNVNINCQPLF